MPNYQNQTRRERLAVRLSSLIIANAMIFQEQLAASNPSVKPLARLLDDTDFTIALTEHWRYIIEHIDYVPIFKLAREIIVSLPSNAEVDQALRHLAVVAKQIVSRRAALRHDLAGRIYHRLLAGAKFLGTYYTSVPAATLLLRLALRPEAWAIDWSHLESIGGFKVADLASGTGTLLMAAVQSITDNYIRKSCMDGKELDLSGLQRILIENVIHGYDVLSSAAHLTATTVALLSPKVSFDNMHIWVLHLGGSENRLGSIDLLAGMARVDQDENTSVRSLPAQISLGVVSTEEGEIFAVDAESPDGRVTGAGRSDETAKFPSLDLCVMNPPFTRSVGGNLLFGSLSEAERRNAQVKLRRLLRQPGVLANSTAGLGAVFVAAGDRLLKPRGRMALVLPRALASGVAWKETRQLFQQNYVVEYVIVSHDPSRWNFSENTSLSEILVVARKEPDNAQKDTARTICLNLWRNPVTITEALALAEMAIGKSPAPIESEGSCRLQTDGTVWGETVSIPWSEIGTKEWTRFLFAQTDLARAVFFLLQDNKLVLPGYENATRIPICPLGVLGTLGPDRRDIYDGFERSLGVTPYPAFWGHDSTAVTRMAQQSNAFLVARSTPAQGRPLRKASLLWPRAGRVMIAERTWLYTQRLVSVLLPERALSNVWWPFWFNDSFSRVNMQSAEKGLVLWLNSTLGLLALLAVREETRGAWCDFKKPSLQKLPVPNFSAMSEDLLEFLDTEFDRLCNSELKPFPGMSSDLVRAEIDRAIAVAMDIPELTPLRQLLAQEPIVSLQPLYEV